ncbi:hypothetical protein PtB15_8B518 [Puccinia triticina]|nr:hypothetical protein PtB15_8B518 [Puccinia triticina]
MTAVMAKNHGRNQSGRRKNPDELLRVGSSPPFITRARTSLPAGDSTTNNHDHLIASAKTPTAMGLINLNEDTKERVNQVTAAIKVLALPS